MVWLQLVPFENDIESWLLMWWQWWGVGKNACLEGVLALRSSIRCCKRRLSWMFCLHYSPNFFYQWLLTKHSLYHVHWQENSAIPSLQAPLDCNLGNSVTSKWLSEELIPRSDESQTVLIRRHNLKGAEDNRVHTFPQSDPLGNSSVGSSWGIKRNLTTLRAGYASCEAV